MISPSTPPGTEVAFVEDFHCPTHNMHFLKGHVTKVIEIGIMDQFLIFVLWGAVVEADGGVHAFPLDKLRYVDKKNLPEAILRMKDKDAPIDGTEIEKRNPAPVKEKVQ